MLKKAMFFAAVLVSVAALAQTVVNQGKPGNQGPWPVTLTPAADGGISTVNGYPGPCAATSSDGGAPQRVTSVGVAASTCPAQQDLNRRYIVYCNSSENTGSPIVKIRIDGTAPVIGIATAGDVLLPGDCILYPISSAAAPSCIANAASTAVTSFECRAP